MDTTLDGLLNRRVTLEQPAEGYRVAVDTVLLAAAVDAKVGDNVLDLGCGVGGAMLCLACRVPGISITGVEIQPELVELCRRNIDRNPFSSNMNVVHGDVTQLAGEFENIFDHVLINPPYHDEARHDVSPDAIKRVANTEKDGDLRQWIAAAAKALKPQGRITLIHRADRCDELLSYIKEFFSSVEVLSLLPKLGAPPRRMIFRAVKGGQPSVRQCKNLVLHRTEGGYTDEAESILRHLKAMAFIE